MEIIESSGKSMLGLMMIAEDYQNGIPITFIDTEYVSHRMETIIDDPEDDDIEDDDMEEFDPDEDNFEDDTEDDDEE